MNQQIPHLQGLLSATLPGSDLLTLPHGQTMVGGRPSPALTSHPESASADPNQEGVRQQDKAPPPASAVQERLRLPWGPFLLQLMSFYCHKGTAGAHQRGVCEMIDHGLQGSTPGESSSKWSSLTCEGNCSYSFACGLNPVRHMENKIQFH